MPRTLPEQAKGNPPKKEDLSEQEQKTVDEAGEKIEPTEVNEKDEKAKAIFLEASKMTLYIPNWVHPQHEVFYKVAYIQVRDEETLKGKPARVRTQVIRKLMNDMIVKMGEFYKSEEKKKEQEKKNVSRRF